MNQTSGGRAKAKARLLAGAALGVVALGCLGGAAHAQTAASGPAEAALEVGREQVVIVGVTIEETQPEELAKYGNDLTTVDSETIRNQAFVDASQTLQMKVPGLFLAPRGGPFSYLDISLQGSRTQDMLFLVDGVRINNRLYSGTITDTLPASMIERIEVLKGGQSLFYGTQAGAGVINVVTRGYTDAFNGMATVGGDTNKSLHLDAYVRGKAGPGNYVLYASQDKSDGFDAYNVVQPSATDRDRSYDVNSLGGKYRLEISDKLSFDARYQHTDARLDYPGARLVAYSKNERDEDIASLGVNYDMSDVVRLQVKGYWHDWDSNYTTINNRVPVGSGQTVIDNQTYWGYDDKGVNALATITPGGPFEYVVGYDYQQYSGKDEVLLIDEQTEEVNAVYAQLRTSDAFIKNAAFAIGVRHNDTGGVSKTVWNASGKYDFTGWLYAQANVGTSFILPTAEQLYAVDPFSTLGKQDIEPEESKNLNISLGGQHAAGEAGLSWQATYFARDIDNLIGFADFVNLADFRARYPGLQIDPDPSTPGNEYFENGYYTNVAGTVEVRGFELLGTVQHGPFSGMASYTHTDTKMDGSANQLARIPVDFAKVGGGYDGGRWGADVSLLWTGEQTSTVTGFGAVNYGDYTLVDIAAHVFLDADQKHKFTARLANAFDEEYATRVSSGLIDGSTTRRFLFANRGQPQTFHLTYSYAF